MIASRIKVSAAVLICTGAWNLPIAALVFPAPAMAQAASQLSDESAAAAQVVRDYYAALNAGDYARAHALWADGGAASGKSLAEFTQGFAHTRSTAAQIVSVSAPEGAMGSEFVTVAVDVHATLDNGAPQHFTGNYTVRRVNGVPGATAAQLNWHIGAASLHPAH